MALRLNCDRCVARTSDQRAAADRCAAYRRSGRMLSTDSRSMVEGVRPRPCSVDLGCAARYDPIYTWRLRRPHRRAHRACAVRAAGRPTIAVAASSALAARRGGLGRDRNLVDGNGSRSLLRTVGWRFAARGGPANERCNPGRSANDEDPMGRVAMGTGVGRDDPLPLSAGQRYGISPCLTDRCCRWGCRNDGDWFAALTCRLVIRPRSRSLRSTARKPLHLGNNENPKFGSTCHQCGATRHSSFKLLAPDI